MRYICPSQSVISINEKSPGAVKCKLEISVIFDENKLSENKESELTEKTIYYVANFAAYIITCIGESIKYFSQLVNKQYVQSNLTSFNCRKNSGKQY